MKVAILNELAGVTNCCWMAELSVEQPDGILFEGCGLGAGRGSQVHSWSPGSSQ